MEKLPKRPRSHILEDISRIHVKSAIVENGWVVRDVSPDYGIDFEVEILKNGRVTGRRFSVQLKATDRTILTETSPGIRLKSSTFNYLRGRPEPVMMILYSNEDRDCMWVWREQIDAAMSPGQDRMTVHFPKDQRLSSIDWDSVQAHVDSFFLSEPSEAKFEKIELVFDKTAHGTWANLRMRLPGQGTKTELREFFEISTKADLERIKQTVGSWLDEATITLVPQVGPITLEVFGVPNGDFVVLKTPRHELGVIDFYGWNSSPQYPLLRTKDGRSPKVAFACLTHPHPDHTGNIDEVSNLIEAVARTGGQFWHTTPDMAEVLRLYPQLIGSHGLSFSGFNHLAHIASVVAERFPRESIRFLSAGMKMHSPFESTPEVGIEVLGPRLAEASSYMRMLHRAANREIPAINDTIVNRASAVLLIRYGDNKIIFGGDAPAESWRRITGRSETDNPKPMMVQAVIASHHGSNDSFYAGLWDDLFGENPGVVLVSANGSTRPTQAFLESFQSRTDRGISDKLYCTGLIDPQRRPESLSLEFQAVLDFASRRPKRGGTVQWGDIEVTIPPKGPIIVSQPCVSPV